MIDSPICTVRLERRVCPKCHLAVPRGFPLRPWRTAEKIRPQRQPPDPDRSPIRRFFRLDPAP